MKLKRNSKYCVVFLTVGLLLSVFIGCGSAGSAASTPSGSAEVSVMALSASDVSSVTLTITGTGIANPIVVALAASQGTWGGTISQIPAGSNRTLTVSVRDSAGIEQYHGQVTGVTITAGQPTTVIITAQQVMPPPPHNNAAPVMDALTASAVRVAPNNVIRFVATAHDPNPGDTLSYTWGGAAGTFTSPSAPSTNWTAPATAGTVHITIDVRDQLNAHATMSLDVLVVADQGQGAAQIAVTLNTSPVVTDVGADPSRVDAQQTVDLTFVAVDNDGDRLSCLWASDCQGTFSDTSAIGPNFTLMAVPASKSCTFTVTVQDGKGGSDTGSIMIAAGPPPAVALPPAIVRAYQSAESAAAGEAITTSVQAVDPNGAALSFAWTTTQGTLGQASTVGDTSGIAWTAPTPFTMTATIQVTITDGIGQTITQNWVVQPSVPTWQWVSGPSLAANAVVSQVWAAPSGEVYVSAWRNGGTGQIPESWFYLRRSGVWSTALHLTGAGLSNGTIFGTSASDVFASVYSCPNGNGACGAGEGPAMWHFDGSAWSQMPIPNIGLNYFQSIRGEVNNVYASYGAGILRYDGTSWSVSSSVGGNVGFGPLAYIGPNEIYTVGCWGYQAWNGSTWTLRAGFDFCDVAGAFGLRTGDGSLQFWVDGSNNFANGIKAWQFVESPKGSMAGSFGSKYGTSINDANGYGSGAWSGVWASGPNDFWVVGDYNNHTEGRIWHWDGSGWARQLTTTTIGAQATCVWGTSPADIWVTLADGRLLHYTN